MKSYLEASLDFMESEEMRDYLREELPKLPWVASDCAEIVAYAPAPIEQKLPVFEQIAQEAEPVLARDGEPFTTDALRFAQSCRDALEERYHNVDGAMFCVRGSFYNGDDITFDDAFFTGFDPAIRYMKDSVKEYAGDSSYEGINYTIYKYLPTEQGQLAEYCAWYLNNTLELWYFEYIDYFYKWDSPKNRKPLIEYGGNLNLPVPFQPGDIIVADCLPYAVPRRILILEVGDDKDCCCLQSLSINKDGYLFTGAVKHNSFLVCTGDDSYVSGLYRARRWTGELSAEEEPFAVLSPLLHARPELGSEIWYYIYRLDSDKWDSLTWQELKNGLGL